MQRSPICLRETAVFVQKAAAAAAVVVVTGVVGVVMVDDSVVVVMATEHTFETHKFDWQSSLSSHRPSMACRHALHRCITQLPVTHCEGMLQLAPFAS